MLSQKVCSVLRTQFVALQPTLSTFKHQNSGECRPSVNASKVYLGEVEFTQGDWTWRLIFGVWKKRKVKWYKWKQCKKKKEKEETGTANKSARLWAGTKRSNSDERKGIASYKLGKSVFFLPCPSISGSEVSPHQCLTCLKVRDLLLAESKNQVSAFEDSKTF